MGIDGLQMQIKSYKFSLLEFVSVQKFYYLYQMKTVMAKEIVNGQFIRGFRNYNIDEMKF